MKVNSQKFFQVWTFFDGRNKNQILNVGLKHFSSFFNHVALVLISLLFNVSEIIEGLLRKLIRTWRKFDIWVLVD